MEAEKNTKPATVSNIATESSRFVNFLLFSSYICMRVNLIKQKTIRDFVLENARSKVSFEDWLVKIKFADWQTPEDIKKTFNSADFFGKGSNRIVFDIAGNNYRIICKYGFGENEVHLFVCWIGTHAQYTKLCHRNEQYTVNIY